MKDQENSHQNLSLSRREALRALAALGGATALSAVPAKWETPIVQAGALPAMAQSSPVDQPFENEIEEISFEGASSNDFNIAVEPGWIIVAPKVEVAQQNYPWLPPSSPWLNIKRKWNRTGPPWEAKIKIKIKMKFRNRSGFGSSNVPKDDVDLWCFGIAGGILDEYSYYVTKFKIKKNKIEIKFELPAISVLNLWPFYLSFWFPFSFPLLNGSSYSPGFFLGPGLFGDEISFD